MWMDEYCGNGDGQNWMRGGYRSGQSGWGKDQVDEECMEWIRDLSGG